MKNAPRLALLLLCSCLAVTSAAGPTSRGQIDALDGMPRQIFRDEVAHLKGANRPVETNHGYFEPQDEVYPQYNRPVKPTKPTYQDDYRPPQHDYRPTYQDNNEPPYIQDVDYPSHYDEKPPYQEDYKPTYEDDYNPTYQDQKPYPEYEDNYKPNYPYQDDHKPNYQFDDYKPTDQGDYKPNYQLDNYKPTDQGDYKPNYQLDDYKPTDQGDYKPNYQFDDYKPSDQDDYKPNYQLDDYKPTYQDDYKPPVAPDEFLSPFGDNEYEPDFKPIDFDINFFGSDNQKPSGGFGGDQYENPKPYEPPQYDTYEPYEPPKPVIPKPYKPVTPKPYKPRPSYPKEIVLLQPSTALKSNAYVDKYAPSDYRPSSVPGTPGKDYPNFTSVPETSFDCLKYTNLDFSYMYGDIEAGCQVFHSCHPDGRQDSFLCPLGTIFDVATQTCDWWFNARCV